MSLKRDHVADIGRRANSSMLDGVRVMTSLVEALPPVVFGRIHFGPTA